MDGWWGVQNHCSLNPSAALPVGGVGWGRRVGDSMGPRRKAAVALLAGAESGSLAGDRDQPPPSNWESKSSEKLFQV